MGRRRVVGSLIILGSLVLIVGLTGSLADLWRRRDIVEERKAALRKQEEENAQLWQALREATSSAFIEKQAREKLGLVKERETVVLIEGTKGRGDEGTKENQKSLPNWKKWMALFF